MAELADERHLQSYYGKHEAIEGWQEEDHTCSVQLVIRCSCSLGAKLSSPLEEDDRIKKGRHITHKSGPQSGGKMIYSCTN